VTYGGIGLLAVALSWVGLAAAEDPVLDPTEQPVRLKKKHKAKVEQEPAAEKKPDEPKKEDEAKKDGEAKKPARPNPAQAEEERKKLVQRVLKNMRAAEKRLAKRDPGEGTRQIQRDILKDLDKLIEETKQNPPQQQCKCSQGGKSSQNQKNQKNQSQSSNSQNSKNSQKPKNSKGGQQPKSGKNNSKGGQQPKNAKQNSGKKTQGKGKTGTGVGQTKVTKKNQNKNADLFKDVWGHLPETLRQEMDAYSRAKFIPKYDALLRQYYRSLSEQSRRKQGE
jgi:hypothetical protein